jgi:hypothetical protein
MAGLSATFVGGVAVINLAALGYRFGWYGLSDVIPTSVSKAVRRVEESPQLLRKARDLAMGLIL